MQDHLVQQDPLVDVAKLMLGGCKSTGGLKGGALSANPACAPSSRGEPRNVVDLEVFGLIPVNLDRFRDFDFSTFRTRLSQHFFSKFGPGKPESGTRKTRFGTWKIGPRQMESGPRQMKYDKTNGI